MRKNPVIAVDFDDTITSYRPYPHTGDITPEASKFLLSLSRKGYVVILWTARKSEQLREAVTLLREANLYNVFDWEYLNDPKHYGEMGKVVADFYVDDRSMCIQKGQPYPFETVYQYILDNFPVSGSSTE